MNKNILITGSTDGIGKLAAKKLAKAGHTIYLHGRNLQKIEATLNEIKHEYPEATVSGVQADFSNLEEVKKFGERLAKEIPRLDVLINNAGVFKTPNRSKLGDLDIRFKVNYLAPYLLTNDLLALLKKGKSRIINLSSAAQARVSLEALIGDELLSLQEAYAQSKLALAMWSLDLAEREKDVSIIAINPGSLLNTKMVKEAYGHYWSSADKGADLLVDLAVSNEFDGISGRYFDNDKGDPRGMFSQAHPDAYDSDKITDLIAITDQLLTRLSL